MATDGTKERQGLLWTTLASVGDGVITTGPDARIAYLNPVAESLLGWKLDEAAGQPLDAVFRIVNEKTRRSVESPVTKALRDGFVVGLANHTILIAKDGTERPIDDSAAPIRDEQGNVAGCVLVFRDITERRRAELALERSERELRDFFENANVGLHWVGPDGTVLRVNRAELDLLGYAREEVIGRNIAEFHADPNVSEDILARLARGETLNEFPARMLCKDGSIKDVLINSTTLQEDGRFVHSRCFTLDVTDRKRAEETRALLAAIVSASDDAIVAKSLDGIVRSWNAGAERLFGYTAEEVVGRPINVIIPAELQQEERSILQQLRRGQRLDHFETVRVAKDGRRIEISLTVSPIHDSTGRIIGASKIARDITDRRRADQALLDADRRKDEFLATLAHELRNPLAPLRSMLEILERADEDPSLRRQARDTMARQLDLIVRLVDDLMDVSRITQGKLQLRKSRIDLAEVVQAAIEGVQDLIDDAGHDLRVTLPRDPVILDADSIRLGQVLTNLLSNAAKYTPDGGLIELSAERMGDDVRISVRDNGLGIPADKLEIIFEMFGQIDHSLERGHKGLGIGLSLVKLLIELHGGRIDASSAGPGKGSEFSVWLPITAGAKVSPPSAPGDAIPAAGGTTGYRVLVVDDNKDAANSLTTLLELLGHEARAAFDGPDAVEAAAEFRPHVVLLDIGLPKLSGYAVARQIRSLRWGQDVVLVAVTGWGQESDRRSAMEAGFDRHLTKPLTLETLQTVLDFVRAREPSSVS